MTSALAAPAAASTTLPKEDSTFAALLLPPVTPARVQVLIHQGLSSLQLDQPIQFGLFAQQNLSAGDVLTPYGGILRHRFDFGEASSKTHARSIGGGASLVLDGLPLANMLLRPTPHTAEELAKLVTAWSRCCPPQRVSPMRICSASTIALWVSWPTLLSLPRATHASSASQCASQTTPIKYPYSLLLVPSRRRMRSSVLTALEAHLLLLRSLKPPDLRCPPPQTLSLPLLHPLQLLHPHSLRNLQLCLRSSRSTTKRD